MIKETEAIKILARVRAIWPRQPIDAVVKAEWFDCIQDLEPWDVNQAVSELRDTGREDPPTPGEVKKHSLHVQERRWMNERKRVIEDGRKPLPEEIAEVRGLVDKFLGSRAAEMRKIAEGMTRK